MILVQERFGTVLIPYGINIGNMLFEIFNSIGMVFLPFVYVIIVAYSTAKAQGLDEGSPAVLAIKLLEKSFYSMFAVMLLFAIPMERSNNQVSFKTHLCGASERSAFHAVLGNDDAVITAISNTQIGNPILPVGIGLINNMSVGIAETISSRVTCAPEIKALEAQLDEDLIDIGDAKLISNLKSFNEQCYVPALNRIREAKLRGDLALANPYREDYNYFFGFNTSAAYRAAESTSTRSELTMQISHLTYYPPVKNRYKPENFQESRSDWIRWGFNTQNLTIPCEDASQDYKDELLVFVRQNLSDEVEQSHKFRSLLPNAQGLNTTLNDVEEYYINQAFLDAVTGKKSIVEPSPDRPITGKAKESFSIAKFASDAFGMFFSTETYRNLAISAGVGLEKRNLAAQRVNMYATIPLITSMLLAIIYAASPIVVILSGYSWKFVFNIGFTIFYLAMVPAILNVSYVVSGILIILRQSFFASSTLWWQGEQAFLIMTELVPVIFLLGWTAACVIAGLNLGPFISTFFLGMAASAAKAGWQLTDSALNLARGAGKGAGKGSKRQM
ncbi:conjugal transfer protein TraG N-terminal domain-containing protein [Vibrio metschnikovii]|nr:conjugal transfer protein TraG N-terminal domain-containing protein [Vibrio metschnikovii]